MKFTKDHEWVKVEGNIATIGITKYAAEALGELVYVELPKVGKSYQKQDACAVVESSKSASDVYIPVSGEVVSVNEQLISAPDLINNSTYEQGWIAQVKISNEAELTEMMNEDSYNQLISQK